MRRGVMILACAAINCGQNLARAEPLFLDCHGTSPLGTGTEEQIMIDPQKRWSKAQVGDE